MIRLICEFRCENPVALLAELEALRRQFGPQEAEAFRSLAEGEDDVLALSMLVESESDISALLEHIREYPALQQAFNTGALELYKQELFQLDGDKWVPSRGYEPTIMWPARGGVRIVIHGAYEENPGNACAYRAGDRRNAPGAWMFELRLVRKPGGAEPPGATRAVERRCAVRRPLVRAHRNGGVPRRLRACPHEIEAWQGCSRVLPTPRI